MTEVHDSKQAQRVQITTDVRIVIEPPNYLGQFIRKPYGSKEYWDELAKEFQGWVNNFEEFLRDHRSQDTNLLSVKRVQAWTCSICSAEWEPCTEEGYGTFCANCGAAIEVEQAR